MPYSAPLGGYVSIERITLSFVVNNGGANEQIHRFESEEQAAEEFQHWRQDSFTQLEFDTPWIVPAELSYQSPIANRSYFACSRQGGTPMCRFLGQYEEYIVRFNTHMSPDFMTYADLERVLRAIDERMARYLKEGN